MYMRILSCSASSTPAVDYNEHETWISRQNRMIEEQILQEKEAQKSTCSVLLMGGPKSGKKTIFSHLSKLVEKDSQNSQSFSNQNYEGKEKEDDNPLNVRRASVRELVCPYRNFKIKIIDVSGLKTLQRKWLHFFDKVQAFLFIADLSSYSSWTTYNKNEEPANRLTIMIDLFNQLYQNKIFNKRSGAIVFLNKVDLFEKLIKEIPLKLAMPEYEGPETYDESLNHIKEAFKRCKYNEKDEHQVPDKSKGKQEKRIYVEVTNATDPDSMKKLIDSALDIVITKNLVVCGLY